jgi:hypothetical protein
MNSPAQRSGRGPTRYWQFSLLPELFFLPGDPSSHKAAGKRRLNASCRQSAIPDPPWRSSSSGLLATGWRSTAVRRCTRTARTTTIAWCSNCRASRPTKPLGQFSRPVAHPIRRDISSLRRREIIGSRRPRARCARATSCESASARITTATGLKHSILNHYNDDGLAWRGP